MSEICVLEEWQLEWTTCPEVLAAFLSSSPRKLPSKYAMTKSSLVIILQILSDSRPAVDITSLNNLHINLVSQILLFSHQAIFPSLHFSPR
jgi:hypothetical protein